MIYRKRLWKVPKTIIRYDKDFFELVYFNTSDLMQLIQRFTLLLSLVALLPKGELLAAPNATFYSSGLLKRYQQIMPSTLMTESRAADVFLATYFDSNSDFQWRQIQRLADRMHIHLYYQLYYQGLPVADRYLKLHYHRDGYIESASSNWKHRFKLGSPPSRLRAEVLTSFYQSELSRIPRSQVRMNTNLVAWVDSESGDASWADAITAVSIRYGVHRRFFVSPDTRQVMAEQSLARGVDQANKVYTVDPVITPTLSSVTLTNLTDLTKAANAFFRVRRNEPELPDDVLVDINPTIDYSAEAGWSALPGGYDSDCDVDGDTGGCPNQSFDGVMVYHHMQRFRTMMAGYFTDLGLDESVLNREPLDVIVNLIQRDSSGERVDGNNAFYLESPCDPNGAGENACIIYLRPVAGRASICGTSSVEFFDLARETIVVAHEYQHYYTDRITLLVPGSGGVANVGDALHEAYSDYFGATYTTDLHGSDVTLVGSYAFQNCQALFREVGELRAYENIEENEDPHFAGLTFATGLWELRKTLGAEDTDRLAIKSLTFLPVNAGFIDSIEALVQADDALNAGANRVAIRELFYNTLRFTGGGALSFKNIDRRIVEVGFGSCSSIGQSSPSGALSFSFFAFWLITLLLLGRYWSFSRKNR